MKKHERRRLITEAVSFAFSNGYAVGFTKRAAGGNLYAGRLKKLCLPGLNCYSCPGALFACPIGALQTVLGSGAFKLSLYALGGIGLTGMLFGRLVCGWICPFGFVQELLYKIPGVKKRKNLPGHGKLIRLKYVTLAPLVLLPMLDAALTGTGSPAFCAWICPSGTLLGGIPQLMLNPSLRNAAGVRFAVKLILLLLILFSAVMSCRPFCKYLCPLGALYSLTNPVSLYRYSVDTQKCVKCGACREVCGMDIKVWETPNSPECIRCGRCKAACPQKAIVSSKEAFEARLLKNTDTVKDKEEKRMVWYSPRRMLLLLLAALLLGGGIVWRIMDKKMKAQQTEPTAPAVTEAPATSAGIAISVFCGEEDGTPVKGVTVQICSGSLCTMRTSDENGLIRCYGMPGISYDVTPIRAPEGYAFVSDRAVAVTENGQEIVFVLRK